MTTPNLGMTLPVVGADADTWGTELNTALTVVDTFAGTVKISDTALEAELSDNTFLINRLQKTSGIPQSATTDVFRFLDRSGAQTGLNFVAGIITFNVVDEADGGNNTTYTAFINSTGNGATNAVLEAFAGAVGGDSGIVRGTGLLAAGLFQLVNDGGGGGVKIQLVTAASGKTVTARVGFQGIVK